ncbi:carbohydrate ABC transporter membrane protein 2, CUT1 family [Alkalibacterium putridalgicola]|uniref:Carbohydrate ABC transporter membrane protein 2, CUT1 family n=1 Tax=Alkalibacterium putridalgicola TaxID=426703 RepID=A0A1H7R956_9LACT|nr:carbohydrate ABC transporter permease [Alkalibacterium putridalgicola]GEK88851.1 sugar ABC transporter permease [Alkalibacterium putridalgicola]SEL56699.1 carbohydrate ABC transporter membrane protein 2, CUT1 family [Alkalibacterium putridalgicola]
MHLNDTKGYKLFRYFNIFVMIMIVVITFVPFINIIAQSFSSERFITAGEVFLIPKGFNVETYKAVLSNDRFWIHYRNTIIYTAVGVAISMFLTTMLAYVLSKPKTRIKGKGFFVGYAVFTMFFAGGIIPTYIVYNNTLNITNTMWSVVFPLALSIYNMLIMKAFFENLPTALEEAAAIDGMSSYGIFMKIVLPLSKPILATMTLFYAVAYWNSWFQAFMFLNDWTLFPVTLFLRNLISGATATGEAAAAEAGSTQIASNVRSVSMFLTVLPIILVYPFVQKYFVSGVMLGSVKE